MAESFWAYDMKCYNKLVCKNFQRLLSCFILLLICFCFTCSATFLLRWRRHEAPDEVRLGFQAKDCKGMSKYSKIEICLNCQQKSGNKMSKLLKICKNKSNCQIIPRYVPGGNRPRKISPSFLSSSSSLSPEREIQVNCILCLHHSFSSSPPTFLSPNMPLDPVSFSLLLSIINLLLPPYFIFPNNILAFSGFPQIPTFSFMISIISFFFWYLLISSSIHYLHFLSLPI